MKSVGKKTKEGFDKGKRGGGKMRMREEIRKDV
jgi:hypothetical protein